MLASVPLDDPRHVRSLEDAFDLTTPKIQTWELHLIWRALLLGLLRLDRHAGRAARDESVPRAEIERVVLDATKLSKDLRSSERQPGINFEGRIAGGRRLRVKVSWFVGYVVVTVHTL